MTSITRTQLPTISIENIQGIIIGAMIITLLLITFFAYGSQALRDYSSNSKTDDATYTAVPDEINMNVTTP